MAYKLKPMEKAVGRRRPKDPTHMDVLLSMHLREDNTPHPRFKPTGHLNYLQPAHRKARKDRLIRSTNLSISFQGCRAETLWCLTEQGEVAAKAARERVQKIRAAQEEWGKDCLVVVQALRAKKAEAEKEAASVEDTPGL